MKIIPESVTYPEVYKVFGQTILENEGIHVDDDFIPFPYGHVKVKSFVTDFNKALNEVTHGKAEIQWINDQHYCFVNLSDAPITISMIGYKPQLLLFNKKIITYNTESSESEDSEDDEILKSVVEGTFELTVDHRISAPLDISPTLEMKEYRICFSDKKLPHILVPACHGAPYSYQSTRPGNELRELDIDPDSTTCYIQGYAQRLQEWFTLDGKMQLSVYLFYREGGTYDSVSIKVQNP
nr:hypothetical protein [Abalone asfa-like virus]